MGREIFPCPHCKGAISVDYADKDEIQEIISKALSAHPSPTPDLSPILEAIGKVQPPKPLTPCEGGTCGHEGQLREAKAELGQTHAELERVSTELEKWEHGGRHHVLTPERIAQEVADCPTCAQGLSTYVEAEVKKRGLAVPVAAPPASEPEAEKMPWED